MLGQNDSIPSFTTFVTGVDTTTLVETGTYLGHMICAQKDNFTRILSIELAEHFHQQAIERFKKDTHVELLLGDSGEVLGKVAPTLTVPTLFWLDGHYSSGETAKGDLNTPIMKELDAVLAGDLPHVVLVDDARLFNGTEDYPTLEGLKSKVSTLRPDYTVEVSDDIIHVCPPLPNA